MSFDKTSRKSFVFNIIFLKKFLGENLKKKNEKSF